MFSHLLTEKIKQYRPHVVFYENVARRRSLFKLCQRLDQEVIKYLKKTFNLSRTENFTTKEKGEIRNILDKIIDIFQIDVRIERIIFTNQRGFCPKNLEVLFNRNLEVGFIAKQLEAICIELFAENTTAEITLPKILWIQFYFGEKLNEFKDVLPFVDWENQTLSHFY